mmetsp:Transcript_8288/g.24859  ORF Transcript_8288/g.24859 Transcript_8288/m.24859 type:complete len:313 (+) Transcript_8288:1522-2460(+)
MRCTLLLCLASQALGYVLSEVDLSGLPRDDPAAIMRSVAPLGDIGVRASSGGLVVSRIAPRGYGTSLPLGASTQVLVTKGVGESQTRRIEFAVKTCEKGINLLHRRVVQGASVWPIIPAAWLAPRGDGSGASVVGNTLIYAMAALSSPSNWFVPICSPLDECLHFTLFTATNPHATSARGPLVKGLRRYGLELATTYGSVAAHVLLMDFVPGHYGYLKPDTKAGWGFADWEAPEPDAARYMQMGEQLFNYFLFIFGPKLKRRMKNLKINIMSVSAYAGKYEESFKAGLRAFLARKAAALPDESEPASKKQKV